jgi:hypothetical protein
MLFRATTDAAERFGHAAESGRAEQFRREVEQVRRGNRRCRCGAVAVTVSARSRADGGLERLETPCRACAEAFGLKVPDPPRRTAAGARRMAVIGAEIDRVERSVRWR